MRVYRDFDYRFVNYLIVNPWKWAHGKFMLLAVSYRWCWRALRYQRKTRLASSAMNVAIFGHADHRGIESIPPPSRIAMALMKSFSALHFTFTRAAFGLPIVANNRPCIFSSSQHFIAEINRSRQHRFAADDGLLPESDERHALRQLIKAWAYFYLAVNDKCSPSRPQMPQFRAMAKRCRNNDGNIILSFSKSPRHYR